MNAAAESEQQVCIELGSNIEPERNLPRAAAELSRRFPLLAISSAWETPPVGTPHRGNYLNAAALITCSLPAEQLKAILREIETDLGRVRTADKFAPRTIDLDILVLGEKVIEPNIWRYAYLAVPVAEVLPNLTCPNSGELLRQIAQRLAATSEIRLCPQVDLQRFRSAGEPNRG